MIAFIPERHLTEVQVDQQVQFYPDRFRFRSIAGHTLSVDDTAVKTLAYPELASVFGGRLPARRDETGGLIPVGSHYKIRITPDEPWLKTGQVVSGRAEIEIVPVSLFQRFRNRALGILIRESGL
jgi:putative peptide zinc metalloprotease protein